MKNGIISRKWFLIVLTLGILLSACGSSKKTIVIDRNQSQYLYDKFVEADSLFNTSNVTERSDYEWLKAYVILYFNWIKVDEYLDMAIDMCDEFQENQHEPQ